MCNILTKKRIKAFSTISDKLFSQPITNKNYAIKQNKSTTKNNKNVEQDGVEMYAWFASFDLKSFMKSQKIGWTEFIKQSGISSGTLSNAINGAHVPKYNTIKKLKTVVDKYTPRDNTIINKNNRNQ